MDGRDKVVQPSAAEMQTLIAYHSGMIAGMGETRNWLASIFKRSLSTRVAWRLANCLFESSRNKLIEMGAPPNHCMRNHCEEIERRVSWNHNVVDIQTFRRTETQRVQNGGN